MKVYHNNKDPSIVDLVCEGRLHVLIQKDCKFYGEWVSDIFNSVRQDVMINQFRHDKKNIVSLSINVGFLRFAQILAIRLNTVDQATFVYQGQPYKALLMKVPLTKGFYLGSDLTAEDFANLIATHLDNKKSSTLVLQALNFRRREDVLREYELILQTNIMKDSESAANQNDKLKQLYFHYHNDQGSYEHFKKNIAMASNIQCCYLELGVIGKKLFELFNTTGDIELLRTGLELFYDFHDSIWLNHLLELAQICYRCNIQLIPVDHLEKTFENVHAPDNINNRNNFIARAIQKHSEENNIKIYTGLFGATHHRLARILEVPSCFLSPKLNSPRLKEIVLLPAFQNKTNNAEVRAFIEKEYGNFTSIEVTETKFKTVRHRSSVYLVGFFVCASITTVGVLAYSYLPKESPSP